ncbi:MAG: tRNA (adenosine(37)-N6)-threonylcarbamoyltransferase complex dimerization subunit type 1 TsaB [Cocleimonas sp.]|nr:tRNA (adenosine(37)-N6)-threonylcarbamoyltransferase complex dimerization subunit type 1 TsaB [Cocleimonas sp.]
MTKILAIETASEACSASLQITDGANSQVFSRIETTPRQHAKLILSMLDEVLDEAGIALNEIDAIAFGRGPGAFTGLRIAAGVAQGVALSVNKPVVAVSTLAALAGQVMGNKNYQDEIVITALDARMGEVYWAVFKRNNEGMVELVGEEQVSQPQTMFQQAVLNNTEDVKILAIGAGWDAYAEELLANNKPENISHWESIYPTAKDIAQLAVPLFVEGKAVSPEEAQPVYIRNNVAKKSSKQANKFNL